MQCKPWAIKGGASLIICDESTRGGGKKSGYDATACVLVGTETAAAGT